METCTIFLSKMQIIIRIYKSTPCTLIKTNLSASSRMIILCLPCGKVTFCWANILILLRTTSMPRSFEAFSSSTAELKAGPKRTRARHKIVVVLPTPGGPCGKQHINYICHDHMSASNTQMLCWALSFDILGAVSIPVFRWLIIILLTRFIIIIFFMDGLETHPYINPGSMCYVRSMHTEVNAQKHAQVEISTCFEGK